MSETATSSEDAGGAGCLECGAVLVGPFCHACGQDSRPRHRPMRALIGDALAEGFSLEGRTFRTADAMLRRPGDVLIAWREGRGRRYISPFKLFLIASAAFFVFLVWSDLAIYQFLPVRSGERPITAELVPNGVRLVGGGLRDAYLFPRAHAAVGQESIAALEAVRGGADAVQTRAIDDFIQYQRVWAGLNDTLETWLPRLLWLLMPVYGLMLWPLFSPGRRLMVEHFVFALWAHAMIFVLLMLFATLNWFGARISFWLLAVPYLTYFILAARRYYAASTWSAAWRGAAHLVAFFLLAWSPVALGIAWAAAGKDLPATTWTSDSGEAFGDLDRWILPPPTTAPAAGTHGPA